MISEPKVGPLSPSKTTCTNNCKNQMKTVESFSIYSSATGMSMKSLQQNWPPYQQLGFQWKVCNRIDLHFSNRSQRREEESREEESGSAANVQKGYCKSWQKTERRLLPKTKQELIHTERCLSKHHLFDLQSFGQSSMKNWPWPDHKRAGMDQ